MVECQQVGQQFGARFGMSIAKRLEGAANVGPHKTSMLQDYLKGRPLEVGSIVDAVIELAELRQVPVPTIRDVKAKLLQRLESRGIGTY